MNYKIKITKNELIKLYINQKKSTNIIAKELGCWGSTIVRKLKKYDISRRTNSESKKGILNPNWKENGISKIGLHQYIRRYKPKPESCEICNKKTNKLDCSNKDHKYTRNIKDYQYVCISCHRKYDIKYNNYNDNYHKHKLEGDEL